MNPDITNGLFRDTDGEQHVRLNAFGRYYDYSTELVGAHAPRLYEQWRPNDDTGIRKEIATRVDRLLDVVERADFLERGAGGDVADTALVMNELYERYGTNEVAVARAQSRYFHRVAREDDRVLAQAAEARREAAARDVPLTDDELAKHRSGYTTLQHAMSEASYEVAVARGLHTEDPCGWITPETVFTDRELAGAAAELSRIAPNHREDASRLAAVREVISEAAAAREQVRVELAMADIETAGTGINLSASLMEVRAAAESVPSRETLPVELRDVVGSVRDRLVSVESDARGEHASLAPEDRWADAARAVGPRVVADPHWPALARSLDRLDAAGHDVRRLLREVTAQRALPAGSPARSLDYRLANAAPEATAATSQPWTTDATRPRSAPGPTSGHEVGRGGPAR